MHPPHRVSKKSTFTWVKHCIFPANPPHVEVCNPIFVHASSKLKKWLVQQSLHNPITEQKNIKVIGPKPVGIVLGKNSNALPCKSGSSKGVVCRTPSTINNLLTLGNTLPVHVDICNIFASFPLCNSPIQGLRLSLVYHWVPSYLSKEGKRETYDREHSLVEKKAKHQVDELLRSFKRHVKSQAHSVPYLWYILTWKMGLVDGEQRTHTVENLKHEFLKNVSSPKWPNKLMQIAGYWWITRIVCSLSSLFYINILFLMLVIHPSGSSICIIVFF